MDDDEELSEGVLPLAATRPALLVGLPLPLGMALGGVGYMIIMVSDGFMGIAYAAMLVAPLWFGARFIVAKDYNACNIIWRWLTTSALCLDAREWGGTSVAHFPLKESGTVFSRLRRFLPGRFRGCVVNRPRGIRHVG